MKENRGGSRPTLGAEALAGPEHTRQEWALSIVQKWIRFVRLRSAYSSKWNSIWVVRGRGRNVPARQYRCNQSTLTASTVSDNARARRYDSVTPAR
jgi:hypothetical protein